MPDPKTNQDNSGMTMPIDELIFIIGRKEIQIQGLAGALSEARQELEQTKAELAKLRETIKPKSGS